MSRHTDLIDAVNDATTEDEHRYTNAFLEGWRAGQEDAGRGLAFVEADEHSSARFGNRPICCGVLLDWKPSAITEAA